MPFSYDRRKIIIIDGQAIDWEFVTSVFKSRKIRKFYEIYVKIRFITSLITAKSSNLHNTRATVENNSL